MNWKNKRVVIIGAARQGIALARYLLEHGALVTLNDQRTSDQLQSAHASLADLNIEWRLGGHNLNILNEVDLLCPSGGVPLELPLIQEALRRGIPLSNDSQIFLENAPCPVVGITGSAGKTTTTTLVGRMAQAAANTTGEGLHPHRIWVGGNIGTPLLSSAAEMQPTDLAVMELSSFQLEVMTCSPQVAAVLNITPNHLDRHANMQAYSSAKRRILSYQRPDQACVLGHEDPGAWAFASDAPGQVWSFGRQPDGAAQGTFMRQDNLWLRWHGEETRLMPRSVVELRGEHNLLNVLAACAISAAVGLPQLAMADGVQGFSGVAHRLEFVRQWGGAAWYNDSIATAPERAMAAIRSFSEPLVLLAGGRDKKLPWDRFAQLVHQRVDHLVLFGEAAEMIARSLGPQSTGRRPYTLAVCPGLNQAVQAAAAVIQPGDVVLLSPGGTSFDEFRDFEARGEVYREWVLAL